MEFKRQKWYLFGDPRSKTRLVSTLSGFWAVIVLAGIFVSTFAWAGIIAIIVGYVIADEVLDLLRAHRPYKSAAEILAVYLPAILIGSLLGELAGELSISSAAAFADLVPSLPVPWRIAVAVLIVTTLAMSMVLGRVYHIEEDESGQHKTTKRH